MRRMGFPRWVRRHILPALVIAGVLSAGFLFLGDFLYQVLPATFTGDTIYQLYHILWPAALITLFGYGWTYRSGNFQETVWAGAPFFLLEGLLLAATVYEAAADSAMQWRSPELLIAGALMLFGVGFREESLFRGLVVNLLGERLIRNRRGVWGTVLTGGILFGLVHLGNYFAGISLKSVLIQTAAACAVGWALCAVYLRGGNLWCMILIHTLTDSASMFYATFQEEGDILDAINELSLVNLTPILPFTAITVFLLREPYGSRIVQRFQSRAATSGQDGSGEDGGENQDPGQNGYAGQDSF